MKIIGCLIWYDEQPSMLGAAVQGLAQVADEIIAVDGAYALFPKAKTRSHPNQAETILRAAETAGVGCTIHRPSQLFFGNEIEKRNLSLKLAAPFCEEGDWILVWDGDYHTMRCDPEIVRAELAATDCLAATYTLLEGRDYMSGEDEALEKFARESYVSTEWTLFTRGIYRWAPDLHYEKAHFLMNGTYEGRKVWVYGPDLIPGAHPDEIGCQALNLGRSLVVYHRRDERPFARREAANGYYRVRDATGIEQIDFGNGRVDRDTGLPVESVGQ